MKRLLSGAGAALVVKAVTGFALAALASTAAGAATEAAITGSVNPADWGQQVRQQVVACKAALETDQHGIGACVSAFAKQHGQLVSDQHRASGARMNHGNGNANANANANGNGNGQGQGANNGKHNGNGNGNGNGKGQGNGQTLHKPDNAPELQNEG